MFETIISVDDPIRAERLFGRRIWLTYTILYRVNQKYGHTIFNGLWIKIDK